jgi:hypothetical protein
MRGAFVEEMISSRKTTLLLVALALLGVMPEETVGQTSRSLTDRAQASILTILPGDATYSAFGHTAIRIRDPAAGVNRIYNYGTFDFRNPLFIPRFVYGRLDYFLSIATYPRAIRHYRELRRPIIEQELRLTLAQRRALFRYLETNALPENRFYRYDFLFDNCSTRIRDALEAVLGDTLRFPASRMPPTDSFRHMLDPYVADRAWLDFGFDLALGPPADRTATPREAMFLPRYLMRAFDEAALRSGGSLVAERDTVFWVEGRSFAPQAAFPWAQLVGWLLLAASLIDAAWRLRTGRPFPDRTDAALFGAVGIVSLLMLFLWLVSEHRVTNRNWNLIWAWPAHLWAAWRLARGPSLGLRRYLVLAAVGALAVSVLWPFWPQDLHAAALPLVLLVAVRSGARWLALHRAARERLLA